MTRPTRNPLDLVNAQSVASTRSDGFIRWYLTSGYSFEETGTVEWEGYFALADIDGGEVAEYVSEEGDPWMSEHRNFEPGHYIIKQNNDGLVWAYQYASHAMAEVDFDKIRAAFADWEA